MALKRNWKDLILKAWSIRFIILAGILSGMEIALPLVESFLPVPPGVFAALSFAATSGAFIARLLTQNNVAG